MIIGQFLLGLIIYLILAYLSYSEAAKSSNWYFPIGVIAAIIANLIWLNIARVTKDPNQLLKLGLFWDVMLTCTYIIVPIVLFSARPTISQFVGILLIFVGIIFTKL